MRFVLNPDTGLRELLSGGKKSKLSHEIGPEATKAFPKRIDVIRNIPDERGLYSTASLHYEKLDRSDFEHSIRLTPLRWRLIVWINEDSNGKYLQIDKVENYHDDRVGKK